MSTSTYHYTECGLQNIYLLNGYNFRETQRGRAVSIRDVDGLHKAIGLFLVTAKKDLEPDEIRFLRLDMLMSQSALARLLGINEQSIRRWENGKVTIPKPSEALLRLFYLEDSHQDGKIAATLKKIADLEDSLSGKDLSFVETKMGWQYAA